MSVDTNGHSDWPTQYPANIAQDIYRHGCGGGHRVYVNWHDGDSSHRATMRNRVSNSARTAMCCARKRSVLYAYTALCIICKCVTYHKFCPKCMQRIVLTAPRASIRRPVFHRTMIVRHVQLANGPQQGHHLAQYAAPASMLRPQGHRHQHASIALVGRTTRVGTNRPRARTAQPDNTQVAAREALAVPSAQLGCTQARARQAAPSALGSPSSFVIFLFKIHHSNLAHHIVMYTNISLHPSSYISCLLACMCPSVVAKWHLVRGMPTHATTAMRALTLQTQG